MPFVLVCDEISDDGLKILRESAEVDVRTGSSEAELIEIAPKYHAMMVRSATKITRPILEAATQLQIVGRAGVGIDNIDVAAATERGVLVVNSPAGNTVAVAELTLGMMLSLVRKLGPAGASMKAGDWKRSKFMGTELYRKTLGVIGTGKIGTEVIKRAQSFGMTVLGYDPFLTTQRAAQLDIEACEIDDICARADFITVHTPLTKETKHLFDAAQFAKMKTGAVIINCSRGGIIDENALFEALQSGHLGGAGLDVFEIEPPQNSPLRELDNVILTPHLGASTEEAQVEVAVDVANQIGEVFAGRAPQSAVNLPPVPPEAREFLAPFLPLAEKLGRAQAQIADGRIESVELLFCGELSEYDTSSLTRVFLKGLLQPSFDTPVTYVNAPMLAQNRGVGVVETKSARSDDYANLIETHVVRQDDGHERTRELSGTVFERAPHIVSIQGLRVDVVPEGTILVIPNTDRPGMIGRVGTLLGDAGINIVGMQVGRKEQGERAVMVLSLENSVPDATIKQLDEMPDLFGARQIDLG